MNLDNNSLVKKLESDAVKMFWDGRSVLDDMPIAPENKEGYELKEYISFAYDDRVNKLSKAYYKVDDFKTYHRIYPQEHFVYSDGEKASLGLRKETIDDVADDNVTMGSDSGEFESESIQDTFVPEVTKQGISEVFQENPELAKIGSIQEYSEYLDGVFPESLIKNIVYHYTRYRHAKNIEREGFDVSKRGAAFFTINKDRIKKGLVEREDTRISAILNIESPSLDKDDDYFFGKAQEFATEKYGKNVSGEHVQLEYYSILSQLGRDASMDRELTDIGVFKPEQIHILGSQQDIEGFRKWKGTVGTEGTNEANPSEFTLYSGGAQGADTI